jgi:nucleoside-diphosphate-sugar epimerase
MSIDILNTKVAIVGATGYVGSALHKYLREQGYSYVRGFDRNPRAIKFDQVVHCPIDVLDDESLHQFDVVIYLGGLMGRKECDIRIPDEIEEENVRLLHLFTNLTISTSNFIKRNK